MSSYSLSNKKFLGKRKSTWDIFESWESLNSQVEFSKRNSILIIDKSILKSDNDKSDNATEVKIKTNFKNERGSNQHYFSNLGRNMIDYILDFLSLTEIKSLLTSLGNKRVTEEILIIYQRKFNNLKFKLELTKNFDFYKLKYFKNPNFGNHTLNECITNYILSPLSSLSNNFSWIKFIKYLPERNILVVYNNKYLYIFKGEYQFLCIDIGLTLIISIEYFPNFDENLIFISEITALYYCNLETGVKKFLYKFGFSNLIYNKKKNVFIGLDIREESLYKFVIGKKMKINILKIKEVQPNDINLTYQVLDLQNYDSEKILSYLSINKAENIKSLEDKMNIYMIDIDTLKLSFCLQGHQFILKKVFLSEKFPPQNDVLISVDITCEIRIWSYSKRDCIKIITLYSTPISDFFIQSFFKLRSDSLVIVNFNGENKMAIVRLREPEESLVLYAKIPEDFSYITFTKDLAHSNSIKLFVEDNNEFKIILAVNKTEEYENIYQYFPDNYSFLENCYKLII